MATETVKERESAQGQAIALEGKTVNAGDGPLTADERANLDIIKVSDTGAGTSAAYLARRIKRDAPEIFAKLEQGEYKSVRAAAIEAGIVHPPMGVILDWPFGENRRIAEIAKCQARQGLSVATGGAIRAAGVPSSRGVAEPNAGRLPQPRIPHAGRCGRVRGAG